MIQERMAKGPSMVLAEEKTSVQKIGELGKQIPYFRPEKLYQRGRNQTTAQQILE